MENCIILGALIINAWTDPCLILFLTSYPSFEQFLWKMKGNLTFTHPFFWIEQFSGFFWKMDGNKCWLRIWIRTRKGAVFIELPDLAILILQNSMIFLHFMGFFLRRKTLHSHQIIINKIDTKSRSIFFLLKMWHSEPRVHMRTFWKCWIRIRI